MVTSTTPDRGNKVRSFSLNAALLIASLSICASVSLAADAQSTAALVELIRSTVAQELAPRGRVEIQIVRITGDLPAGRALRNSRVRPVGRVRSGMVNTFLVEGTNSSGLRARAQVAARVIVFRPVVVAVRDIRAGKVLTEDDVALEERNIDGMLGEPLFGIDMVIGRQVSGSLRSGSVITRNMLREPYAVQRGDVVQLTVVFGHVYVQTEGRALQSGRIGDSILVRNNRSGRTLRGVVVARGQVRIQP